MAVIDLRLALNAWRSGREEGYPICCIARFCWDWARGDYPSFKRPHRFDGTGIPCGVFHRVSAVEKAAWAAIWIEEWEGGDEVMRELYGPPPRERLGR